MNDDERVALIVGLVIGVVFTLIVKGLPTLPNFSMWELWQFVFMYSFLYLIHSLGGIAKRVGAGEEDGDNR